MLSHPRFCRLVGKTLDGRRLRLGFGIALGVARAAGDLWRGFLLRPSPDRLPPEPPFGGDDPSRPPLANDLFVDKDLYRQFRNAFPQFLDVIGELLPRRGWSIENALQQLDAEASKNSRRKQQLAAIR